MNKSLEVLKFEASERALALEIERNPQSCPSCSMWQSAGDMANSLFHCPECGSKLAWRDIKELIDNYAIKKNTHYEAAWDVANDFLKLKQSAVSIYFDEDYLYSDLNQYFNTLMDLRPKCVIDNPITIINNPKQESWTRRLYNSLYNHE